MSEEFWLNNPLILMNKKYIYNIIPSSNNTLISNLNTITRVVIFLSFIGYTLTRSIKILISAIITIAIIIVMYKTKCNKNDSNNKYKKEKKEKLKTILKEGFSMNGTGMGLGRGLNKRQSTQPVTANKYSPTKENPFMNVQMQEYKYKPTREESQPSANPNIEDEINEKVKESLDPRLFQNLGDNIEFNHSMRSFHTTPNTQIPNNQKEFAEFCYGNMSSCKEDSIECVKNNYRWTTP